jgi:hypothetical protein
MLAMVWTSSGHPISSLKSPPRALSANRHHNDSGCNWQNNRGIYQGPNCKSHPGSPPHYEGAPRTQRSNPLLALYRPCSEQHGMTRGHVVPPTSSDYEQQEGNNEHHDISGRGDCRRLSFHSSEALSPESVALVRLCRRIRDLPTQLPLTDPASFRLAGVLEENSRSRHPHWTNR